MEYLGIDVSKESFDVYHRVEGHSKYSNKLEGFEAFLENYPKEVHCVMEASGPYYLKLATFLYQAGIVVSVVNPLVIRRFCQMNLQRAKTDRKDAQSICLYGEMVKPQPWKPAPEVIQMIQQLQTTLEQLAKQLRSSMNTRSALMENPKVEQLAIKSLESVIKVQQAEMKKLEEQIKLLATTQFGEQLKAVKSVPGIGDKTAITLLVITQGFSKFENSKQLISYVGLSPRVFQSGKSVNRKPRIAKIGMSQVRKLLFMCSLQAIKTNQACKDLFKRLRSNGKPAKVALMAVANKLVRQAFAVVTQKTLFKTELSLA